MKYQRNIILFISLVALLFVFAIKADAQKAEFGLRFMPTFSAFEMKTSSGGTVKGEVTLGFGAGALLGFNFSKHVGVQGELIYSTVSQKYKELDVERKVNLRYFNIPLLLSLNTNKTGLVNLNIVGGPQIGISAGSELFTSGSDGTGPEAVLSVKKGDLGFAYGAGIDFALNQAHTFRLGLGYRGVLGLFDISNNTGTIATNAYYIIDRTHINTNAIYFGISLLF
ncbi:MAG: PorT family protein [Saprospirales bacterium]|nr:PorT family protein [Saprospirales bacterium]MBK8492503.1 PorT family protein [Saprospirales bacterium]